MEESEALDGIFSSLEDESAGSDSEKYGSAAAKRHPAHHALKVLSAMGDAEQVPPAKLEELTWSLERLLETNAACPPAAVEALASIIERVREGDAPPAEEEKLLRGRLLSYAAALSCPGGGGESPCEAGEEAALALAEVIREEWNASRGTEEADWHLIGLLLARLERMSPEKAAASLMEMLHDRPSRKEFENLLKTGNNLSSLNLAPFLEESLRLADDPDSLEELVEVLFEGGCMEVLDSILTRAYRSCLDEPLRRRFVLSLCRSVGMESLYNLCAAAPDLRGMLQSVPKAYRLGEIPPGGFFVSELERAVTEPSPARLLDILHAEVMPALHEHYPQILSAKDLDTLFSQVPGLYLDTAFLFLSLYYTRETIPGAWLAEGSRSPFCALVIALTGRLLHFGDLVPHVLELTDNGANRKMVMELMEELPAEMGEVARFCDESLLAAVAGARFEHQLAMAGRLRPSSAVALARRLFSSSGIPEAGKLRLLAAIYSRRASSTMLNLVLEWLEEDSGGLLEKETAWKALDGTPEGLEFRVTFLSHLQPSWYDDSLRTEDGRKLVLLSPARSDLVLRRSFPPSHPLRAPGNS